MHQRKKMGLLLLLFSFLMTSCQKTLISTTTFDTTVDSTDTIVTSSNTSSIPITFEDPSTSADEPSTSIDDETSTSPLPVQLTVPSVSINAETGLASWAPVSHADYYEYIISAQDIKVTLATSVMLEDKTSISVRAMSSGDYVDSDWSVAKSFFVMDDIVIPGAREVKIYFHNTNISPQTIQSGEMISRPQDPQKQYYQFDDWYGDPYMMERFDFGKPITKNTIIYANWLASDFLDGVYYWIKGDEKMSSSGSQSSASGWKLIPLKRNEGQINYHEYKATVNVSDETTSSKPCYFLIMDGVDTLPGRNYWKDYGSVNFEITASGTYTIYFSAEHQWMSSKDHLVNVYVNKVVSSPLGTSMDADLELNQLETPVLQIDMQTNLVSWSAIQHASAYGYTINNGPMQVTNMPQLSLRIKDFISVIALGDGVNYLDSYWSSPVARYNIIEGNYDTKAYCYVFFFDMKEEAQIVKKGEAVIRPINPVKDGYRFGGWYSNISRTKEFNFSTIITENLVLYPKWIADEDWKVTQYYYLADLSNSKIAGLLINQEVLTHYEYVARINVSGAAKFVVKDRYDSQVYGPYEFPEAGTYTVYFSPDRLWNPGTENASNIYIAGNTRTLYFTNALLWSGTIYAYIWRGSVFNKSFPGESMTWVKKNSYSQDIYKVSVDMNKYSYIIFSNGANANQTVNILLVDLLENGVYTKSTKVGNNYEYGTFAFIN